MINLLPVSFRRQQIVRLRVVQWSAVMCVFLITGWGWHWYKQSEVQALSNQLESLQREHAPHKAMLKQLVQMRQKLEELQQQEGVAMELEHQRNALTLLGVISKTAEATDGRVRVTRVDLSGFQNMRHPAARETHTEKHDGLTIAGVSLDNAAVVEMLDGLQDSGIFSRVELLVSKERLDGESALRDYEVRCEF
jgi:Tfp pilus assembly protein PilN